MADKFHLDYPAGTLGLVIISQPAMFEKAFLPFLAHTWNKDNIRDPIDQGYISSLIYYPDCLMLQGFTFITAKFINFHKTSDLDQQFKLNRIHNVESAFDDLFD